MSKFKLVGGVHTDENGKTYSKGDKIESDSDLVKLFPNKFELVGEPVAKAEPSESPGRRTTLPGAR